METTSEYAFPIFISSTDYNLKDLRAELSRFLKELGYRPILSSAEGFPDNSPNLEPWESCIPVLDNCFVMILVIDGRYSKALEWPNFQELFEKKSLSPTHGEYLFAHKKAKRMLVFIRKEVMTYYQSYRQAYKNCNKDEVLIKETLEKTLPDYIDYETLKFVHQVKTSKPIPWIKEFDDITDVKNEVQKKMLNELAEIFLIKNQHLQTVINSFNKVLSTLSEEEQQNALTQINATKPFIEAFEKTQSLSKELEETKQSLTLVKGASTAERKKHQDKIAKLEKEINQLEKISGQSSFDRLYMKDGKVQISNPGFIDPNVLISGSTIFSPNQQLEPNYYVSRPSHYSSSLYLKTCAECQRVDTSLATGLSSALLYREFNDCPKCNRHLCNKCWPKVSAITTTGLIESDNCPKCTKKNK